MLRTFPPERIKTTIKIGFPHDLKKHGKYTQTLVKYAIISLQIDQTLSFSRLVVRDFSMAHFRNTQLLKHGTFLRPVA